MKPDGELFEVRIPKNNKGAFSGYFTDADTLIKALKKQDLKDANVYLSLNKINEACYARKQRNTFIFGEKATQEKDIDSYEWMMIDLDPVRPSGTSSSEEELEKAKALANDIYKYLQSVGFEKPITALSGNGVHLLYRIDCEATKQSKSCVETAIKVIGLFFSTKEIDVDLSTYNLNQTCKLYGTLAQKGINTEDRPHRMSEIVHSPAVIKPTKIEYIEKLCAELPTEPEKPQKYNNYNPKGFDIEEWLNRYGIGYQVDDWNGMTKYKLNECPYDANHKNGKASIFKLSNGAIKFKCMSVHCIEHTWQDVRRMFEPDAYEKKEQYEQRQMFGTYNRNTEPKHIQEREGEPIFFTARDIVNRPKQTEHIIKSGIDAFDKKYRGFRKKDVTLLSGYTGGAKSTLLSELILNAIQGGNNVACFSGELAEDDYFRWMIQQAAGKKYVAPSKYEGYFNVPKKYQEQIADWLDGKFWLYNNKYGFNFGALFEQLEKIVDENKLDMLCIDNLMALDISELSNEKYDAQAQFAWKIHELAQRKDIHIIIVCHPRKPTGLLSKYDISGTADIVNAVDNIVFVYRIDQSFENYYNQFFRRNYEDGGTNAWHCDKARFGSVDDSYNPLFYERETLRLKNSEAENKIYGWLDKNEEPKEEPQNGFTDTDENPFT